MLHRNKIHVLLPLSGRLSSSSPPPPARSSHSQHELLFAYKCVALRQGLHEPWLTLDFSTHLVGRLTRAEYLLRLHDGGVRCGDHGR